MVDMLTGVESGLWKKEGECSGVCRSRSCCAAAAESQGGERDQRFLCLPITKLN